MGISILTAAAIIHNDVYADYGGPAKATEENPEWEGKYAGFVIMKDYTPSGCERPRMLLSTPPIYGSPDEAKLAMQQIIDEIREKGKENLFQQSEGQGKVET